MTDGQLIIINCRYGSRYENNSGHIHSGPTEHSIIIKWHALIVTNSVYDY